MADRSLTLTWPESDIALVTFDTPNKGANVMSSAVCDELSALLDEVEARKEVAGLIIASGKPGIFIAGADLREFAQSLHAPAAKIIEVSQRGQQLYRRLARADFVTVAAIDGLCLGGGGEVAIWCDRRIMSEHPRCEFGFPEVKLGLFPGWGGTVRGPRMLGLANAVELITGGESLSAAKARDMGLVSVVVPSERLVSTACELIRIERVTKDYLLDRKKWSAPLTLSENELGFLGVTASAVIGQQTKGKYPAPEAALALMMETASDDEDTALRKESEQFAELFGSPVNVALLNVFFLTDRNKKDRGIAPDSSLDAQPIGRVGVVGAGIMGAGIAAANLRRDLPVLLFDARPEALARGARAALEEAAYDRSAKAATTERCLHVAPLLAAVTDARESSACDLVVEAIIEKAEAKRELYQQLEPLLPDHAILASNTSTIPIAQLAAGLARPEQFVGVHFFNPVRQMKLVEVIRGPQTSDQTVATAVAYAKRLGKSPVVVKDGPGFLVNRLLLPYMTEALELLSEGVPIDEVERAAKSFGMPMGPLTLYDMVGLDTAQQAGQVMVDAFPDRLQASPILAAMLEAGRLGRKNGKGFFDYQTKTGKAEADPAVRQLLHPLCSGGGETPSREQLIDRLFLPMLQEATLILQDELVRDPRDIDLSLIYGLGFPPFRGGLLFWADRQGASSIVKRLEALAPLGERFQPAEMLRRLASQGGVFYSGS